jgi:GNAT superfamily N-acetyltransferase
MKENFTQTWEKPSYADKKDDYCTIELGNNCSIQGLFSTINKINNLEIRRFNVNEKIQKQGIGKKLLDNLMEEAKKRNVQKVTGNIVSEGGLRSMAKYFKKENLHMKNPKNSTEFLNFEEALEYLGSRGEGEGIMFEVNL